MFPARSNPLSSPGNAAFLGIALAVLGWTAFVLTRPEPVAISYMTDDAFYYLVPAYFFAHGAGWTFDHVTPTSGFQLLYGYVAAAVSLVSGYSFALPALMTISSAVALLAGVWVTLNRGLRLYGAPMASAVVLTLAAPRAFLEITVGLEWAWAVMFTALLIWTLQEDRESPARVALAALLVTLVRVDLSMLVAIYAVAIAAARWHRGEVHAARAVRLCAAAAAGAALGLAITGVNSWAITGSWVPNSVAMKEFWSRTNAFQPAISWDRLMSCTGPGAILTSLQQLLGLRSRYAMAAMVAAALLVCRSEWRKGARRGALAVASAAAVAAYTMAYASGVNLIADHYSGSVVIPMMILTCGLLSLSTGLHRLAGGALGVGVVLVMATGSWSGSAAHLVLARHASDLFARVPPGSRVAAWNAGISGWRTGGQIINLDGLANAEVVAPIKAGRLACFLSEKEIDYVMDFGFMFAGEVDPGFGDPVAGRDLLRTRNGYDPVALYSCVSLAATADDTSLPNAMFRLFRTDRDCIKTLCEQ